jgi:hypothetical protein
MTNKDLSFIHDNAVKHILYDLSIEDIAERRAKAVIKDSAAEVASYLGVAPRTVFKNRSPGKKIYSNFLKKHFAVRIYEEAKNLKLRQS